MGSAIIGGPVGTDILSPSLLRGWHEWDGVTWVKHRDAGVISIGPVAALSRIVVLIGFTALALNARYIERRQPTFMVNNHETFWSIDGEYFIFWCNKESRWKLAFGNDLQ